MTRSRSITLLTTAAVGLLSALTVSGCGGGGAAAQATPLTTADGQPATVGVADNVELGQILVNSQGRTLYLFKKDSGTTSSCIGACAASWPPLLANGQPTVGSGANASMVATTTRPDGSSQATYNGHPLYLYIGDKNPGDANGQGLTAFGGSWFALSAAGTQVAARGSNSAGGGY